MASQLSEFHYHLTQGGKFQQFDFEEKSFDIKNIFNHYIRKVSASQWCNSLNLEKNDAKSKFLYHKVKSALYLFIIEYSMRD